VGKVYNLYRVKTDISAVLTVKSGLDTHMIIKLKDDLNRWFCLFISMLWIDSPQIVYLRVCIYLHLANAYLIKTWPTKNAYRSQTMLTFPLIIVLHVI
jgi:hypothetical protein